MKRLQNPENNEILAIDALNMINNSVRCQFTIDGEVSREGEILGFPTLWENFNVNESISDLYNAAIDYLKTTERFLNWNII